MGSGWVSSLRGYQQFRPQMDLSFRSVAWIHSELHTKLPKWNLLSGSGLHDVLVFFLYLSLQFYTRITISSWMSGQIQFHVVWFCDHHMTQMRSDANRFYSFSFCWQIWATEFHGNNRISHFFFQSIYKYIDRGNDDSEFIPHIFNATILSYKLKSKQNRSVGNFSNILNTSTHYQYQAEMTNTNIYRIYMFRNVLLFYSLCELV